MYCKMVWSYTLIFLALDSSDLPKLAIAFVVILFAGWLTLVITMGYQLFRRTSSRSDFNPNDTIKGMSASERDWQEEAEKLRADLLAFSHVSHTIEKEDIKLAALYFPELMQSELEAPAGKIANDHLPEPAASGRQAIIGNSVNDHLLASVASDRQAIAGNRSNEQLLASPASDRQVIIDESLSEHLLSSASSQSEYADNAIKKSNSTKQESNNPFKGVCAVVVHGWQGHPLSRAKDALQYLEAGFSVLMPALRGHEPTGGNYSDLFLKHYDDLGTWMDLVTKKYGEDESNKVRAFVLDGVSMGASNVLKMAGDPKLPDSVVAVIADCGYTSLREEGRWMLHKLPFFLRFPVLIATQLFYGLLTGVWSDKPTPLDRIRHAQVPIFIIHGKNDLFVPTWMGEQLYEACVSKKKELWIVPNATHATSNDFAGADYKRRRHQFIEESLRLFDIPECGEISNHAESERNENAR